MATVRRHRLVALAVTIPVLLAVGLLRFDAARIEHTVDAARAGGDCPKAVTALDRVWFGHHIADAPMTALGDNTIQACQRLTAAKEKLTIGRTGDTAALTAGFGGLAGVLARLPGHEKMVDTVLDGFLAGLPTTDPCHTAVVTDWLRQRPATHNTLDRAGEAIARTAPDALVGCGDQLMARQSWDPARVRYQQLLDQYPGHALSARAQEGVRQATLALELANVRGLLAGPTNGQPAYCSAPAQYSGAAPYGPGTNRTLLYGNDEFAGKLPAEWRATDAADAVLVVCAGTQEQGAAVRTCPYVSKDDPGKRANVTFRKVVIPVKAYELRTGRLVLDTKVELGGASCPPEISYLIHFGFDPSPPDQDVAPSDADVRAAFRPLITP
jgi:hypothetical protein